ncbi:MAG: hypothetical protein NTV93_03960 [Verrucomicrobia bacterium]|nr:hypothetical protein [Verrucomicrobiota bacterium]
MPARRIRTLLLNLRYYFEDPLYGRERRFLFIVLPLCLLIAAGIGLAIYISHSQPAAPVEPAAPLPLLPAKPTTAELIDKAKKAYESGNTDSALFGLAKIDLTTADSPVGWELAGLLREKEGDMTGAFESYSNGLATNPSADLFYRRALVYRGWENLPAALADLDAANRLDPHDPLYTNERYLLLIQMGLKENVRAELTGFVTSGVRTDTKEWIFALAAIALENAQYNDAAETLGACREAFPPGTFSKLLKSPVMQRHQAQPEILPFYINNSQP